MRYTQTKAESEELLRVLLPSIARFGSGCQPSSYALWYEYAAGTNLPLRQELDARMAANRPLSEEETAALYARHVAPRDIQVLEALQAQLHDAVDGVSTLAVNAHVEAKDYGRTLEAFGGQLAPNLGIETLRRIVGALAAETQRKQQSNELLTERLDASQRDFRDLMSQLHVVQNEAMQDPLTGLQNRRGFQRFVDQMAAESAEGLVGTSLLLADIDHFKRVNDQHGHLIGDKVLQLVAQLLQAMVKGSDLAVRFGGEEFAIVLPHTAAAGAMTVAEQIRKAVAKSRIRRGEQAVVCDITISLGVCTYREGESVSDWIARCDLALYQSKRLGRNRVTLADHPP